MKWSIWANDPPSNWAGGRRYACLALSHVCCASAGCCDSFDGYLRAFKEAFVDGMRMEGFPRNIHGR